MKPSEMLEIITSRRTYGCALPNCVNQYGCTHTLGLRRAEQTVLTALRNVLRAREGILSGEEPGIYLSLDAAFLRLEEQIENYFKEDSSSYVSRSQSLRLPTRRPVGRPRTHRIATNRDELQRELLLITPMDENKGDSPAGNTYKTQP